MSRVSCVLLFLLIALCCLAAVPFGSTLTVHIVPHTHDDVGWLKTVDQYYYGLHNDIQHAAVQYILKTVTAALIRNPQRKFMYVEQAFFQRFWREALDYDKNITRYLVANGQLEFVNGGWCMHDEAAAHYIDMIDQTTLGHKFIAEEFGVSAIPSIGWQIDPFGHSATQAALLSAEVGFNGLFFGRIDYQDHDIRLANQNLEFVWRASPSLGQSAQIFSGAFQSGNYGPPGGFCWDVFDCGDEVIQSNPNVPEYNLDRRVQDFIKAAKNQAGGTRGDVNTMNIMWTMGSDFQHEASEEWMTNLDKIIDGVNAEGSIKAMYSTPSIYLKAKNAEPVAWTVKTDDFFPYADGSDSYWTGYFTSRPALKRYVRINSFFLQLVRHFEIFAGGDGTQTEPLWEAMGIAQHHDAVSGTAKQAVTFDYAQRLSIGAAIADQYLESAIGKVVTKSGGTVPTFNYCPLANVSSCSASTSSNSLVVLFYNALARPLSNATISIPLATANVNIYDANNGPVKFVAVPVAPNNAIVDPNAAKYRAWFQAYVPGLGANTYFVTPSGDDTAGVSNTAVVAKKIEQQHRHTRGRSPHIMSASTISNTNNIPERPSFTIENDRIRVTFDSGSGLITSVTDLVSGTTRPFTQDFAYYPSYQGGGQDSGAYIFRPNQNWAVPLSNSLKVTNTYTNPLVSEVWQQINDWISVIVRLRAGTSGIEFEW